MVVVQSPRVLGTPLTSILSPMLSSIVVMVVITIVVSIVPVTVWWIVIAMSGLGSLVFWLPIAIRILKVVRIVFRPGRRTGEVSPVVGIRMRPVFVPLPGVWWWAAVVPVLLRIPVVVLSVLCSVRVPARVGQGVTSVIHDKPSTQDRPTLTLEVKNGS